MTEYKHYALSVLKNRGFRITKPRQLVVELLDQTTQALSAYEIKEKLDSSGEKVDTVSIYRILECLEDNHLIHRLLSSGKVLRCQLEHESTCHLDQQDHCHHLLICEKCLNIQEVHCPGAEDLVARVEKHASFVVKRHNMEFLGLCGACSHSVV